MIGPETGEQAAVALTAVAQTGPAVEVEMGFAIIVIGVLLALTAMTYELTPNPVALLGFGLSIIATAFWFLGIISVVFLFGAYVMHGVAMAFLSVIAWWL